MHFVIFFLVLLCVHVKTHISGYCAKKNHAQLLHRNMDWKPMGWTPRETRALLVVIAAARHAGAEHPRLPRSPAPQETRSPKVSAFRGFSGAPPPPPWERGGLVGWASGQLPLNYWISNYLRHWIRGRMNRWISKGFFGSIQGNPHITVSILHLILLWGRLFLLHRGAFLQEDANGTLEDRMKNVWKQEFKTCRRRNGWFPAKS